jgi:hypothetical protein
MKSFRQVLGIDISGYHSQVLLGGCGRWFRRQGRVGLMANGPVGKVVVVGFERKEYLQP